MKAKTIKEINNNLRLILTNNEVYYIDFNTDIVVVIDDYLLQVNNVYINTNYVVSIYTLEKSTIHKVEMQNDSLDLKIL